MVTLVASFASSATAKVYVKYAKLFSCCEFTQFMKLNDSTLKIKACCRSHIESLNISKFSLKIWSQYFIFRINIFIFYFKKKYFEKY